jgi:hypothetical protein
MYVKCSLRVPHKTRSCIGIILDIDNRFASFFAKKALRNIVLAKKDVISVTNVIFAKNYFFTIIAINANFHEMKGRRRCPQQVSMQITFMSISMSMPGPVSIILCLCTCPCPSSSLCSRMCPCSYCFHSLCSCSCVIFVFMLRSRSRSNSCPCSCTVHVHFYVHG